MPDGQPWTPKELDNPHDVADKARRVRTMFAAIASSYDLNNRVHSLGRDRAWRRAAARACNLAAGDMAVDVACGTGDLTLELAAAGAARILGLDFTPEMLALATAKSARQSLPAVCFAAGDAMCLPLPDACADAVTIAFGIRNVASPPGAIAEFARVLRPGGRLVILEFGLPRSRVLRRAYQFYFHHILPRTASWIARDHTRAYRYLPRSVETFLDPQALTALMRHAGFGEVALTSLSFGIALLYRGVRAG